MEESAATHVAMQAAQALSQESESLSEPDPVSFAAVAVAEDLREGLFQYLHPLLLLLDAVLDVRLVRTLLATCEAILSFRHRNHGLLLSE
jgi:hypothetical protein